MITLDRVDGGPVPRLPVGEWITTAFDWVDAHLGDVFTALRDVLVSVFDGLTGALTSPDALLLVAVLSLLAWWAKNLVFGVVSFVGLSFVVSVDLWDEAMATLSLVLVAATIALVVAIPLGVLAARSRRVSAVVRPVMDLMQTMPAFVWLVPVVTLLSIGPAGGVVATVIFCLPPGVRLTELGIRQVDREVVEAGHSFGSTPGQILRGIQLPLALPTIMAGINQVIMLALSMAVIAGMAGTDGSGKLVVQAISTLDLPLGVEAGLGVVILAVFLDRVTAALGNPGDYKTSLIALAKRRRATTAV